MIIQFQCIRFPKKKKKAVGPLLWEEEQFGEND